MRLNPVARLAWVAVALAAWTPQVAGSTRAFLLPSRQADAAKVAERMVQIATRLASRLSCSVVNDIPRPDLSAGLQRARAAYVAGQLSEAASLYDAVLEEAARVPHLVADPAEYLTAHLLRASIALAESDRARALALVARAVKYDP